MNLMIVVFVPNFSRNNFSRIKMAAREIVKHVGNYHQLIYKLLSDCREQRFSFSEFLEYARDTQTSDFCSAVADGTVSTVGEVGRGFIGSVGPVQLCESSQDELGLCGQLQQLCISYAHNHRFFVFTREVVKKILALNSGTLKNTIPLHHTIPERYMELITNIIANVVYDAGQNPHIVKTYSLYPCANEMHILMEYANEGNLRSLVQNTVVSKTHIKSYLAQGLMAAFSLYYHSGILHLDTHLGNCFLQQFAPSEPGVSYYSGQDLYGKKYLHYHHLPVDIFGVTDLVIDTHNHLLKLGDYGLTVTDLSKAHNSFLKCQARFSELGETRIENIAQKMRTRLRQGIPGITRNDLLENIAQRYFTGVDTSAPLVYYLHMFVRELLNSKVVRNQEHGIELRERLTSIVGDIFSRHPASRSGIGSSEDLLRQLLHVFGVPFQFPDGRNGLFVGDPHTVPRTRFAKVFHDQSLHIDWRGHTGDSIFTSLRTLYTAQKCEKTDKDCTIENLDQTKFAPSNNISDSYSLDSRENVFQTSQFRFTIYRDFSSLNRDGYTYAGDTYSPGGSAWPQELQDRPLRGLYAIHVTPQRTKVDLLQSVDLTTAVTSVTGLAMAINGGYFLVESNINNALNNIQPKSQLRDPLGLTYIDGVVYVNPFPPVYEPWLAFVCITYDGHHVLLSQKRMLQFTRAIDVPFTYCIPGETPILFTRNYRVPDVEYFATQNGFRYIYQVGPLLLKNGQPTLTERDYQRQFHITQEDINNVQGISPNKDPQSLLNKRYCLYAKTTPNGIAPDLGFDLFCRDTRSVPTLYGMNHSNVFMNHNVLLYHKDHSISFLLVSGRGYGSEGIDRAQLARWLSHSPFAKDIKAAISLDGGFSANAVVQKRDGSLTYALEDPERRAVGLSYLFH